MRESVPAREPGVKSERDDKGAGVLMPPPLYFILAILVGVALDRLVPLRFLPSALELPLASIILAGALALFTVSLLELRRHRTTIRPDRASTALVTRGPYSKSRNPIYLADAMIQVAAGVWLNNLWIVLLVFPTAVSVTLRVILREERHLAEKFGEAYEAYRARVPRWL